MIEHATEAPPETPEQGYKAFLRASIVGDARGAVERMTALAQMSMIDRHEIDVEVSADAARFVVSVPSCTGVPVSTRIEMSLEDGRWLIAGSSDV